MLPPLLTTPRLFLRPYRADDDAALFALHSDPFVMRYWSRPPTQAIDETRVWLREMIDREADDESLGWALALSPDGELIGTGALFNVDHSQQRVEIGYALRREWWKLGYAREAVTALIDHAFGPLALRRIEADVDPRNTSSTRLLLDLGFTQEGLLRERWCVAGEVQDSALFGLLSRDWSARASIQASG